MDRSGSRGRRPPRFGLKRTIDDSSDVNRVPSKTTRSEAPDLPEWLTCPCCCDVYEEPHIISCGHTVCEKCLSQLISHEQSCPVCQATFDDNKSLKNTSLLEAIRSWKQIHSSLERSLSANNNVVLEQMLALRGLNVTELDHLIHELQRHSEQLKQNNEVLGYQLSAVFLRELLNQKSQDLHSLQDQLTYLRSDLHWAEERAIKTEVVDTVQDSDSQVAEPQSVPSTSADAASSSRTHPPPQCESMSKYRQRIDEHFEDLKETYFNMRQQGDLSQNFATVLGTVAQYNQLKPLREFYYNHNTNTTSAVSNIVSSISFDYYEEFFAVSGVCKQIKIYNYSDMLNQKTPLPYPVADIKVDAKVSCVCWLACPRSRLVNADYEGNLTLWDVFNRQPIRQYKEHEKRVWSVDASRTDPNLITSASDDGTVRLWSTENAHPVKVLQTRNKVNICSVQFHPTDGNYLAFGASDHFLYYYDLRQHRDPVMICKGHKKAVSYVTFCNSSEICTASIDGTLKLWSVNSKDCIQTYTGHQNEKNFVGLDTNQSDWIACGSEDNSLYVYYKHVSKPLAKYRFEVSRSLLQPASQLEEAGGEFLSAVCWRKKENIVFAANSQGLVKLFQLG